MTPSSDEKTPLIRPHAVNYSRRYDQVSWRSADTDFEPASSIDEHGNTKKLNPKLKCLAALCTRRRRKIIALVVVVFAFFCIMGSLIYLYYSKPETDFRHSDVVETDCGSITGIIEAVAVKDAMIDSYVFKGIPYAIPPLNGLRWKPSIALSFEEGNCWKDTFEATAFGAVCAQVDNLGNFSGSEDCLQLNVWSPSLDSKSKLPVFVWFHGGYLMTGNGNIPGYSPSSEFVTSMNIVAVSMNFRLNAFGFLTLKELWEENEFYGNYGLMDQVLVLKWIKDNIVNFGGDPNSVTLVGQSSGGSSIIGLLVSPMADGLFHKAISMSGSPNLNTSYKKAAESNKVFLSNTMCKFLDNGIKHCLLNLTTDEVLQAVPRKEWEFVEGMDFPIKSLLQDALIVVEPIVIPISPNNVMSHFKPKNAVSVLIGSTAQEIGIQPTVTFFGPEQWGNYKAYLKKRLDDFSPGFYEEIYIKSYSHLEKANKSAEFAHETVATDVRVTCPTNELGKNFASGDKRNVFRYIVTHKPNKVLSSISATAKYAFHCWDAITLFDYKMLPPGTYVPNEFDENFKNNLRENIRHFMEFGHMKETLWSVEKFAIFNESGNVVLNESYHGKQCDFWNNKTNGFAPYAWKN